MSDKAAEARPPYDSGYFPVSGGHRLYYERYGTEGALPVLFVHGGPGAGFSEDDKAFFDPERFDVLLVEQRGAGRSEPFASLEHNDTDALVEDMTKLLEHVSCDDVFLFGGSWGSTLSLVFAIRHPERVRGLLLRGVFLADDAAIGHFIEGGIAAFYPEVWERFAAMAPAAKRDELANVYLEAMRSDDEQKRERFCYEWARYELSLIKLVWDETPLEEMLEHYNYRSLAALEAHYTANRFFLPDGYILGQAGGLSNKPVSIVHGRYDMLCPPKQAYDLHRVIEGSTLRYVPAGHSSSEAAIRAALIEELDELAPR